MKFKFYLSSLIFLLATFFMVNAQTNTVTGKVTDGVDALSSVNVIIQGTNTGVSTDDNGVFTLSSDKDLPWTLEISSLGFQGQNLIVNSTSQVISISLSSGEELDEVVISGSRKPEKSINAASSITVIGTKEIENKSVFNSLSLVDDVAGLQVDRQGANKLNITLRDDVDLLTTSTLVMQDYRALNLTGVDVFDSNASNLSSIDLERVEVVLGPASALYGPGVGSGVVHFLTKDPFKYPGTTLQIQGGAITNGGSMLTKGNFNMYNMNFRHATSNEAQTLGYKLNLKYSENKNFDFPENTLAQYPDNVVDATSGEVVRTIGNKNVERSSSRGVDASIYYRPSNNFSLTTVAGISEVSDNIFLQATGENRATQRQAFIQTRLQSNNLFVQWNYMGIQPHKSDNNRSFIYRTGKTAGVASTQSQLQIQYELAFDKINTDMSVGVEHKFATFETNGQVYGRYEDVDDYRVYGAYFSTKTDLSDKLNLQLAGRYDKFPAIGENSFSPRVALVYKPSQRHSLRLTFNKAFIPDPALYLFVDTQIQNLPSGYGNVWILGNRNAQTFNNVRTRWLFGGGAVPSNPGIGMSHATLFGVLAQGVAPLLPGTALQGFIPFLTSTTTLAAVAGTGGFTTGMLFDLSGNYFGPLTNSDKSTLGAETHYELGYKGMLSDNFTFNFNVYNSIKENFVAQMQVSPLVALPTLATDFAGTVGPMFYNYALNTIFPTMGLPAAWGPTIATQLGTAMTNTMAGAAIQAGLTGAVGVVETDQAPGGEPSIMFGWKNFGRVSYWGFESGVKWRANDNLTLWGNYSSVSQTTFRQDALGSLLETGTYSLNHAKERVKVGFVYDNGRKWNLGMSYKYDGGYEANKGQFYSGLVDKRNVIDANIGFDITTKTLIGLNLYNLTDTKYSIFPNMPLLGRQMILTLKHDF